MAGSGDNRSVRQKPINISKFLLYPAAVETAIAEPRILAAVMEPEALFKRCLAMTRLSSCQEAAGDFGMRLAESRVCRFVTSCRP